VLRSLTVHSAKVAIYTRGCYIGYRLFNDLLVVR
jgi:hypothetical protein